jgi:hypothetical protein
VHILPRRVLAEQKAESGEAGAGAEDVWGDRIQPRVLDLVTADVAVALPNYEGDRRRA